MNEGPSTDFEAGNNPVQPNQSNSIKAIQNSVSSGDSFAITNNAQSTTDLPLQPRSFKNFKQ